MANSRVRLRIDFGPGHGLGPGKISLLEQMQRTGSLSEAAKALGMSYRRAWVLVQSMNALFDEPLVRMTKGGRGGGGGAQVTARGRETIVAFRRAERQATLAVGRCFHSFEANSGEPPRHSSVKRLSAATTRRKA
jgi:molybdate transport system regulatory protein